MTPWKPPGAVPSLGVPGVLVPAPSSDWQCPGAGRAGETRGCLTIKPGTSWRRRGHFPATSPCTLLPLAIPAAMKQTKGMCPGILWRPFPTHTHSPCCQMEPCQSPGSPWKGARGVQENVSSWGCWGGIPSPWVWGSLCPKRCGGVLWGVCGRKGLCFLLLAPAALWDPGEPSPPSLKSPVNPPVN